MIKFRYRSVPNHTLDTSPPHIDKYCLKAVCIMIAPSTNYHTYHLFLQDFTDSKVSRKVNIVDSNAYSVYIRHQVHESLLINLIGDSPSHHPAGHYLSFNGERAPFAISLSGHHLLLVYHMRLYFLNFTKRVWK